MQSARFAVEAVPTSEAVGPGATLANQYSRQIHKIEQTLSENGIEFRRGLSGGGNQLLQPYIRKNFDINHSEFPNVQHIHNFSWYIGNHPHLEIEKIDALINLLNETVK